MNALESQLDYPLGDAVPERGAVIEVAPGLLWARMALPFALDHINVWLLRDEMATETGLRQGWTIVDCGIGNDQTHAAWETIFATALGGLPVLRVIVTHMHPDHIGSAHWLCERWNIRMWISATDYNVARIVGGIGAGIAGPLSAEFMSAHGMVVDATDAGAVRKVDYRSLVPSLPASYRRLIDGKAVAIGSADRRSDWMCHVGYGHAPEHMALHDSAHGVLIAGDMVLPRISTNVSVTDIEPESDPLTLYLESIERMRSLPADTLVLPSHGRPFKGLHRRIDQLQEHHADRFTDVLQACAASPRSAFDLVPVLFRRKLDGHQMSFAMGESIAHCHALWLSGKLERKTEGGVIRFATV